jgi:hypothetical protein
MRLDSIGSQPSTLERTPRGTVLFADLRGYVGMAERLAPSYLATLLDEYFGVLTVAVEMHGGEVYHTAGDALMAGFGLSKVKSDGALAALRAGCEMLSSFATLAERWRRQSHIEAGMGVGLHLGELALATFGPPTQCRRAAVQSRAGRRGAVFLRGGRGAAGAHAERSGASAESGRVGVSAAASLRAARPARAARHLVHSGPRACHLSAGLRAARRGLAVDPGDSP